MKLSYLISRIGGHRPSRLDNDFEVEGISCNSKSVKKGFVFVAIKGARQDGDLFIREAIGSGASAIIVQGRADRESYGNDVPIISVKDTRKALAKLAAEYYQHPSRKLNVVGITGTNGKTTISYLIEAITRAAGFAPGVIGTINCRYKGRVIPSKNTTPGPLELQSLLKDMVSAGVDYAVMEVSSHSLSQERVMGVDFSAAIFTNLTRDHLDYHKTFGEYFLAKSKLFAGLGARRPAIINIDDAWAGRLMKVSSGKLITYGIMNKAAVMAKNIRLGLGYSEFILSAGKLNIQFKIKLAGRHNIYNCLAAISWALSQGLDIQLIRKAIEGFSLVPGRMERIDSKKGFSVFVDYAHTDDALKNVIGTLREITQKKIIVVFGCGGDRDRTKRPKMGKIVTSMADLGIITNDNPRSEDPLDIIGQIKQGIKGNNYRVIPERAEAIKKALSMAKKGDAVLVAGKGHEDYQIIGKKTFSFDDRKVVRKYLSEA